MLPHVISGSALAVYIDGQNRTIDNSHPNFTAIRSALREGEPADIVRPLINIAEALKNTVLFEHGMIQVGYDEVTLNGEPIHNYLVNVILKMAQKNQPVEPWVRFLERLLMNPNEEIRQDLFR